MTQGRAIGKNALICSAALVMSAISPSNTWSAPPSHANKDKPGDTTDQSKPRKGRRAEPSNSAPAISGVPDATTLQERAYDFLPTADDPDGDTLSFSVTNLPRWATFDTTSGRLFGTPGLGDIGLYSDIRIDVSDGQANTVLPVFAVEVMAYASGTTTLSWAAPTQNTDGSPLLDLAGYEIHWGSQSGGYSSSVELSNPGIATYMIENLTAGTHYFAIKAVTTQGMASAFSYEAVKTIAP
jgi:hypothetical protein